jgi:hypothetical protein
MTEPTTDDRTLDAFRKLVRNEDPRRTYQGLHEYAVQRADAATFDGLPTDPTFSPQLPTGVPYRPALAGSSCVPTAGTLAYVAFANQDPSKPILVAFGPTLPSEATVDATGTVAIGPSADTVELAGGNVTDLTGGVGRVVRYGDPIVFSAPGPGTITAGAVVNHFSKVTA